MRMYAPIVNYSMRSQTLSSHSEESGTIGSGVTKALVSDASTAGALSAAKLRTSSAGAGADGDGGDGGGTAAGLEYVSATPAVTKLKFSKSGSILFCCYSSAPYCVMWNTLTGVYIDAVNHPQYISDLTLTADGKNVLTSSWDGLIRVWRSAEP